MAEAVVVLLEPVDVEQYDDERTAALRRRELRLERQPRPTPVGHARQLVRQRPRLRARQLPVQELGQDADPQRDHDVRADRGEQHRGGPQVPAAQRRHDLRQRQRDHPGGQRELGAAPTAVVGQEERGDQREQPEQRLRSRPRVWWKRRGDHRHGECTNGKPERAERHAGTWNRIDLRHRVGIARSRLLSVGRPALQRRFRGSGTDGSLLRGDRAAPHSSSVPHAKSL